MVQDGIVFFYHGIMILGARENQIKQFGLSHNKLERLDVTENVRQNFQSRDTDFSTVVFHPDNVKA